MFLSTLNNEQKKLFLELATKAAAANDVIEESERILLNAYAMEMGISNDLTDIDSLDKILNSLKEISNSKELNQITFEIVGMVLADKTYDDQEKEFMNKLMMAFEIPQSRVDIMINYVQEYTDVVRKINILMFD